MPTGRDFQTFLQRNMHIFHADDIGIFCKHKSVPEPFITITDECMILHGVPWTPETYYNYYSEKGEITVCRCREHAMDVFGWTTSFQHATQVHNIDSFYGMRLLEVPFHEEPWQGTGDDRSQQYVYIVAATLTFANYRQVLYLKEIKSAHNELYEMFAYSDLCWNRKYVPKVFQLREVKEGYPIHHYDQRLDAYIDRLYHT